MTRATTVRDLEADDLPAAIGIMTRGMRDNPLHISALGRETDVREARLNRMFTLALPMILRKGVLLGAFDGDMLVGVAGMVPPGRCQPSLAGKIALLPRMIPAIGFRAFGRVGRWIAAWGAHDLREPHWHLGPVAVDAHLQGQGIGRVLMAEYCARLDRMNAIGYLETDKPGNVVFYEKFGFETVAEAQVVGTSNWFLRRPALVSLPVIRGINPGARRPAGKA
jgi:ribosomal protein S18 acetylase RimI-like enzyme